MDTASVSSIARALGAALEPVIGQVYFAPECHSAYQSLGFAGSPGEANGVALPDGPAYFTSRGSVMGHVSGQVVAAAFAVFNPEVVVPCVDLGWSLTDATTICAARDAGATAQLRRVLGDTPAGMSRARRLLERAVEPLRPEGRPLFAGLRGLDVPADDLAAIWRLGDQLREYRGDSHTAAWVSAGCDATEIGLLTELYWGLPMRTYSRTRGWSTEQFDGATERLRSQGLIATDHENGDDRLTESGRALRESIEIATDAQSTAAVAALGTDDAGELIDLLTPWGAAVRAERGYPPAGPHDLAARSNGTNR
jgi:hypothetical protein